MPSANDSTYPNNSLSGVSALSPTAAWAVGGSSGENGIYGSLNSVIEQWDGSAWHMVATPSPGGLYGVAAVSPSDVWAVGRQFVVPQPNAYTTKELILHWNGTQWSAIPSPNSSSTSNGLNSVAAISANDVWAVGSSGISSRASPLVEHWDGVAWRVVATPAVDATDSPLFAVTRIPGTNQLWAVGYTQNEGAPPAVAQVLIERWEGTTWQIVHGPTLPSGSLGGNLIGVVALSTTDAWAVGTYIGSNYRSHILIAHWDGTTWQMVASPDVSGYLVSLAASGPHDVRAVGTRDVVVDGRYSQHPLIEQWDGTAWQVVSSPEPSGTANSDLRSITADGAGAYWAVGISVPTVEAGTQTLTLHCP